MSNRVKGCLLITPFLFCLGCTIFWYGGHYWGGYIGGCSHPFFLTGEDLVGTWQTSSGAENGTPTETIVLFADRTYQQRFENGLENVSTWELISDELDSPKIKLHDALYYFEDGPFLPELKLGNVSRPRTLVAQNGTEATSRDRVYELFRAAVRYPEDGYIYLFPQFCQREIKLRGMINYFQDPDNVGLVEPIYLKLSD